MSKPTASACFNCVDRTATCHATCKRYKAYQQELKEWNERVIEEKKKYKESFIMHDDKTWQTMKESRYVKKG